MVHDLELLIYPEQEQKYMYTITLCISALCQLRVPQLYS